MRDGLWSRAQFVGLQASVGMEKLGSKLSIRPAMNTNTNLNHLAAHDVHSDVSNMSTQYGLIGSAVRAGHHIRIGIDMVICSSFHSFVSTTLTRCIVILQRLLETLATRCQCLQLGKDGISTRDLHIVRLAQSESIRMQSNLPKPHQGSSRSQHR